MALFRSGGGRLLPAGKVKAVIGILFLSGLWLAIAQYSSKCSLWRLDPSSSYIVPGVSHNANKQANSVELSNLLKEALQCGAPSCSPRLVICCCCGATNRIKARIG